MPTKEQNLTVYPISSGDELNIFAEEKMIRIRIMDMHGNQLLESECKNQKNCTIDIQSLNSDTYLAEVTFKDEHTARSVFVKL